MGGPSPSDSGSSAPPSPPMWTPLPAQHQMRSIPWSLLSFASKVGGFLLIFIGVLVAVVAVSYPSGCVTTPCTAGQVQGFINALLVARILWVLGLLGLGVGAGVKLHFVLTPGSSSDSAWLSTERRSEGILFLISVILFFAVFATINVLPPWITG